MSKTGKGILRRDRYTCQNCGATHSNKVVTLQPPSHSVFRDKTRVTACNKCAPLLESEPYPHVPIIKHLISHGFTVQQGHPYLHAHLWAVTNPMQPNPYLGPEARQILASMKNVEESIDAKLLRSYNKHLDQRSYYRGLAALKAHAYVVYNPANIEVIHRFDVFTPPPVTPDMSPLVAQPRTLLRLRNGPRWPVEPALLLAHLYKLAGMTLSGVRLKRLLRHNLPETAKDLHAVILHKLLKYMTLVRANPEGGWTFTTNHTTYTNRELYGYLEDLYTNPWLFVMPSDDELAQGVKPQRRRYRDPIKRPRRSRQPDQTHAEPASDPLPPASRTTERAGIQVMSAKPHNV